MTDYGTTTDLLIRIPTQLRHRSQGARLRDLPHAFINKLHVNSSLTSSYCPPLGNTATDFTKASLNTQRIRQQSERYQAVSGQERPLSQFNNGAIPEISLLLPSNCFHRSRETATSNRHRTHVPKPLNHKFQCLNGPNQLLYDTRTEQDREITFYAPPNGCGRSREVVMRSSWGDAGQV